MNKFMAANQTRQRESERPSFFFSPPIWEGKTGLNFWDFDVPMKFPSNSNALNSWDFEIPMKFP